MKPLVCGLALASLTIARGDDAFAYVRTKAADTGVTLAWDRPCVTLYLQLASRPAEISEALFETAALGAASAWGETSESCSALAFAVRTSDGAVRHIDHDGRNTVQFRVEFWGRNAKHPRDAIPYPPAALAITSVFANRHTGKIVEAEIEINAKGRAWDDLVAHPQPGELNVADLQDTLTHEFGHVIGLDHTCDAGGQSNFMDHRGQQVPTCPGDEDMQESTMSPIDIPGQTKRRTLSLDDRLAVCEIYPRNGQPACFPAPIGGDAGSDAGGMANTGDLSDAGDTANVGGVAVADAAPDGAGGSDADPSAQEFPASMGDGCDCAFAASENRRGRSPLIFIAVIAMLVALRGRR